MIRFCATLKAAQTEGSDATDDIIKVHALSICTLPGVPDPKDHSFPAFAIHIKCISG